jgi:PhnB protein
MANQNSALKKPAVNPIPEGYHTITPYIVVQDAPGLIDFIKKGLAGEETFRTIGSAGGIHAEMRVGDSMLMIGGGGPELAWSGKVWNTALHTYVKDTDAVYRRAIEAGGVGVDEPRDQEYGERSATVKDAFGNYWYIATALGAKYLPEGLHSVNVYLHPVRAPQVIDFLQRAFGAEEKFRMQSPDGIVHHAAIRMGDSILEMGEAQGKYQPMGTMCYLYVPDVDALYQRAIRAGGTSLTEPKDQPYGDRTAGINDPFGNCWYLATHVKDMA